MHKKYNKDTYCHAAMSSYSVHGNGRVRPCCMSKVSTNTYMPGTDFGSFKNTQDFVNGNTIEDFINDPALMDIRRAMINGEKHQACKECWKLEERGVQSFRQIQNELYQEDIQHTLELINDEGYLDKAAITYLDVTLGNVCNLKCRSCNPWASHSWIEEGPTVPHSEFTETTYKVAVMSSKNPWFMTAFYNGYFDTVLSRVKVINFLGGEPLVVKEHYDWLEHIVTQGWAKNISLQYNSNGTTIPKRVLELWTQFKHVTVSLSLDAVGDLAYYVRYPSKWHVIQKNVGKLANHAREYKNLNVQTHMTLSCLNLHDLPNMLDWCKQQYDTWHYVDKDTWKHYGYINLFPHFNIVETPYNMHIRHLPQEQKDAADKMLTEQYLKYHNMDIPKWEHASLENIKGLKNVLGQSREQNEWQKFLENTAVSDNYRCIDIIDYIPWMEKYIEVGCDR